MTPAPLCSTSTDSDAITAKLARPAPADVIDEWLLAEVAPVGTAAPMPQQRWGQLLAAASCLLASGALWWLVTS